MRQKIVAGNWKMYKNKEETENFSLEFVKYLDNKNLSCQILIAAAFPFLDVMKNILGSRISLSAQDLSAEQEGAYTGEVSAKMLASISVDACLVGHSERRQYHAESNTLLNKKIKNCIQNDLLPIYCVGETLEQRKSNQHFQVVKTQLVEALEGIYEQQVAKMVFAYEPVWAIGTGEVATPEQAEEMHAFIREEIEEMYNQSVSSQIRILYGGSVKPNNAEEIFSQPNVDGGLIGGASLSLADFVSILEQTEKLA